MLFMCYIHRYVLHKIVIISLVLLLYILHIRKIAIFVKGKGKGKRKDDFDEYHDEDSIDSNEADGVPDAAKSDIEKHDETAIEDEFGAKDYRSQMILKPDSTSRPLWVVRLNTSILLITYTIIETNLFFRDFYASLCKTFQKVT